jgi:transcriptional regulator with XRE-family HTH domain
MLSAYETGKQRPTLDTLEKILSALESDLGDLFDTLQVVNERPLSMRYRLGGQERPGFAEPIRLDEFGTPSVDIDVRRILGGGNIQPAEEEAVAQMIRGYFRWLRTLRDRAVQ